MRERFENALQIKRTCKCLLLRSEILKLGFVDPWETHGWVNSPCEPLIFASKILHVCTYLIFWRKRMHSFHRILKDVCDSKMIKNHYSSPTLISFASEKNKVIISESEVPPILSTSIFPCHRNPRQEVKEKFPGKRRLSKDPPFPSGHGPWTHPGVHIPSWRERERDNFLFHEGIAAWADDRNSIPFKVIKWDCSDKCFQSLEPVRFCSEFRK